MPSKPEIVRSQSRPWGKFHTIGTGKRASVAEPTSSDRPVESSRRRRLSHLYFPLRSLLLSLISGTASDSSCPPAHTILSAIPGVTANAAQSQPEIARPYARVACRHQPRTARTFSACQVLSPRLSTPTFSHCPSLLPFLPRFQAPRATERLRPAARRSSASLSRLSRFWFLPLRGHPPRKQTLALGNNLALAPSGWCALRDSGHQRRFSMYVYVKWNSLGLRFARRRFGH